MPVTKVGSEWSSGNLRFFDVASPTITLFDIKTATNAASNANYIWVSTEGSDTTGTGTFNAPYALPSKAMTAVSATRKTILLLPGTYTETSELTWSTISGVSLIGLGGEKWATELVTGASEDQVINVAPGVQTSTWEMRITNLIINHDNAGQDGLLLTHTSVGKKMNCYLHNIGSEADSDSDKTITVTHGGAGNAVRIYITGRNSEIGGAIYQQVKDGGDRLYIEDAWVSGGIEFSTDAVANTLRLRNCVVKHEGVTGGSTSTVATAMYCASDNSGTYALLDTNDIAGNITGENVFPTS